MVLHRVDNASAVSFAERSLRPRGRPFFAHGIKIQGASVCGSVHKRGYVARVANFSMSSELPLTMMRSWFEITVSGVA